MTTLAWYENMPTARLQIEHLACTSLLSVCSRVVDTPRSFTFIQYSTAIRIAVSTFRHQRDPFGTLDKMITNQTCHGQIADGPPTNEPVIWQVIFFALATFCINTMSQPAGAVCGGEPSLGSMLRCSPIMCLVDTSYMLYRLTHFYIRPDTETGINLTRAERLQEARLRLLRLRYQPWVAEDKDGIEEIMILQKKQMIRIMNFALIAIGAAKFFSLGGLYWSKAIAGVYLGSFIFVELLIIRPRGDEFAMAILAKRETAIDSSGALSLSYISVALAVVFLCFFGALTFTDPESPHYLYVLFKNSGTAAFSSWVLPLLFTYLMCMLGDDLSTDMVWPTILLVLMLAIPWMLYAFGSPMAAAIGRPVLIQAVLMALGMFWVGIGTKFASAVTSKVRDRAGKEQIWARQRVLIEKSLAWYFVLLHFLTALLYLSLRYNSTGTRTAPWSKVLGR